MTPDSDDGHTPGTVPPAEYRRAGCGMRYGEGELKAGIDFSGAAQLRMTATESVLIRDAAEPDAGPIARLANLAYRGEASRAGWTTEADLLGGQRTDRAMILDLLEHARFRLVFEDTTLLASVQIEPLDVDTAEIGMLAVLPERQGQGIGRRLLFDAETVASQNLGARRLRMRVLHQRQELIDYYQRLGYQPTGETAPFPESTRFGEPLVDDLWFVVLEKPVGSEPA